MKGVQDTTSSTLRQLLGNGLTYEIPKFQRDYSWETEQWDDLWQDIQSVVNDEEPGHYLGYLVLQTKDDKVFKVIDGQQRITTISILILSAIKALQALVDQGIESDKNAKRVDSFRNNYIGYLDPVTLIATNKLRLNRNNDNFYRSKLVPLEQLPQRGLNSSERLMKNCFEWFETKIKGTYATGEAVAEFIDKTIDKIFFTVISVNDELNAFKVFETLNARGVQLSASDLLKNYLFSVVDSDNPHKSEISEIESIWGKIIGKLGSEKLSEFLRVYWNSKYKTVRKNDLFKAIRRNISHKKAVFDLLRNLDSSADTYMALRNPFDELWKGDKQITNNLTALKIFQVRQPFSLLLAAYEHLNLQKFKKALSDITTLSFRYNIISGLNPNDQETVYNELSQSIRTNNNYDRTIIKKIDPKDDSFVTAFSNKEFKRTTRNHKIVKYILSKVERKLYSADIDLFSDLYTIEHVMPESNDARWEHIPDEVFERCIYRLGNLVILENKLNKESGTKSYKDKKLIYSKSSLLTTQSIPQHYDEWGEDEINSRQRQIAHQAKQIWKI